MLINTIDDIKLHIAVDKISNFSSISPYVKSAEIYLKNKILGTELYNIIDEYNSQGSGSGSEETLEVYDNILDKSQNIISNLSFLEYIPVCNVHISDSGIRIVTTDTMKTAFQWQIEDLKQSFQKNGYDAVEDLLQYLEENIDKLDEWKQSEAYILNTLYFINNAIDFSKYYNINASRLNFLQLIPAIKKVEDFYIKTTISDDYFSELKDAIALNDISDDDQTIIDMIKPALANLSVYIGMFELGIQFENMGMINYNYDNKTERNITIDRINPLINHVKEIGTSYINKLREYLNNNASADKYKTYYDSDNYTSPDDEITNNTLNDEDSAIFIV